LLLKHNQLQISASLFFERFIFEKSTRENTDVESKRKIIPKTTTIPMLIGGVITKLPTLNAGCSATS